MGHISLKDSCVFLSACAAGRYSALRVPLDGMGLSGECTQSTDSCVTAFWFDDWLLTKFRETLIKKMTAKSEKRLETMTFVKPTLVF